MEEVKETKGFVDEFAQNLAYCEAERANLSQHFEVECVSLKPNFVATTMEMRQHCLICHHVLSVY